MLNSRLALIASLVLLTPGASYAATSGLSAVGSITDGGSSTATIAAATAGPTVIKSTPGFLSVILITTAGTTGTETFYDNASACSGTIIGIANGTTAQATAIAGYFLKIGMAAANGITACGGTLSPALTVGFY